MIACYCRLLTFDYSCDNKHQVRKETERKKSDNVNKAFWFTELSAISLDKVSYNLATRSGCAALNVINRRVDVTRPVFVIACDGANTQRFASEMETIQHAKIFS